jgi:hypothetical protein
MSDPAVPVCKDCGASLGGPFCHSCGQRALAGRLRFADVGRWLVGKLLDADRGLLMTMRELTLRPGPTIQRYVDGQRTRFTNPFAYLFIGGAVSALLWTFTPDAMRAELAKSAADDMRWFGPLTEAQSRAALGLWEKTVPYAAQVQLAVCLPLVFILRLFFRRSGHNLAEISVFALFVSGQLMFVSSLAMLPLQLAGASTLAHGLVVLLSYIVVVGHAAVGFFDHDDRPFRTTMKMLVALTLAMTIYELSETAALRWYVVRTS